MQVDWADFGLALLGVPRRVSAFVAVLCYVKDGDEDHAVGSIAKLNKGVTYEDAVTQRVEGACSESSPRASG